MLSLLNNNIILQVSKKRNILFVTTSDRVYGLGINNDGVLGLGHNRPIHKPEELLSSHPMDGDLKPDNVLIANNSYNKTNYRYIKLCDFGLSKEVDVLSDRYNQTNVNHTGGVAQYMAPEAQFGTDYNHLIDVYSLALIGAKIFGFDSDDIRDGVYIKS
ncbi:unnamed protein product [Medioppia subpectinata]|uniref:Protein kinase domain-containing protein n=1 Tax=Medioppia subpectinata TaxID=1979941 RepID=A0A7R9PWY4_9ACAR|nr:unnamed protein product [Medioppia subpectinata]CAG2104260.1 unnamed protein product [Medioppia subpectinata]